jgi:hypothetical protein
MGLNAGKLGSKYNPLVGKLPQNPVGSTAALWLPVPRILRNFYLWKKKRLDLF